MHSLQKGLKTWAAGIEADTKYAPAGTSAHGLRLWASRTSSWGSCRMGRGAMMMSTPLNAHTSLCVGVLALYPDLFPFLPSDLFQDQCALFMLPLETFSPGGRNV